MWKTVVVLSSLWSLGSSECQMVDCSTSFAALVADNWLKLQPCKDNPKFCIPEKCFCDGLANCLEGGDERGCGEGHFFACREGYWKCSEGTRCIPRSRKCDSFHDCADESDESAATCGHDHVKNPDDRRPGVGESHGAENEEANKGGGANSVLNILGITLTTLVMVVGMLSVGMIIVCIGKCCRRRQQNQQNEGMPDSSIISRLSAVTAGGACENGAQSVGQNLLRLPFSFMPSTSGESLFNLTALTSAPLGSETAALDNQSVVMTSPPPYSEIILTRPDTANAESQPTAGGVSGEDLRTSDRSPEKPPAYADIYAKLGDDAEVQTNATTESRDEADEEIQLAAVQEERER